LPITTAATRAEIRDYTKAISDYDKAIALNPQDAAVLFDRGNTKYRQRDHGAAIADYSKAIELNPAYDKAYNSVALQGVIQGSFAKRYCRLQ